MNASSLIRTSQSHRQKARDMRKRVMASAPRRRLAVRTREDLRNVRQSNQWLAKVLKGAGIDACHVRPHSISRDSAHGGHEFILSAFVPACVNLRDILGQDGVVAVGWVGTT